jgi:hypothetical protein
MKIGDLAGRAGVNMPLTTAMRRYANVVDHRHKMDSPEAAAVANSWTRSLPRRIN